MELLEFIFQDGEHFWGTAFLILVIGFAIQGIFRRG